MSPKKPKQELDPNHHCQSRSDASEKANLKNAGDADQTNITTTADDSTSPMTAGGPKGFRVLWIALISLTLLWLAFPPIGIWFLGWIAPLGLIALVTTKTLPARCPYWQLFYAGLLYWLGTFYFIPIPHPALWAGWFVVSFYLAIYTPLFVGISRTMVHRFKIPVIIAAPVVWTGLEWIRSNLATGMAMVCLSHTQYKQPQLIQIADLSGAYTLTFVMMLCSAGIFSILQIGYQVLTKRNSSADVHPDGQSHYWIGHCVAISLAILVFAATLMYGRYRLAEPVAFRNESTLKAALIQTSNDVDFAGGTAEEFESQIDEKYNLTWQARAKWKDLDLIIWPESGWPYLDLISDLDDQRTVEAVSDSRRYIWSEATGFPNQFQSPVALLTGGGTADPAQSASYNAAYLIGIDGSVAHRYFKNHLVMFGEYVPLANRISWINAISPIPSLTSGTKFETMTLNNVNIAPSICFETTVPHLIRRQVNSLSAAGQEPDVLVNLTNDGWFYGTSCLDLHLACNVFRAVEMRKPHWVCANTGFSAEIDNCGRLLQTGPRRSTAVLNVQAQPIQRSSMYRQIGDWIPMTLGGLTLLAGLIGWWKRNLASTKLSSQSG